MIRSLSQTKEGICPKWKVPTWVGVIETSFWPGSVLLHSGKGETNPGLANLNLTKV